MSKRTPISGNVASVLATGLLAAGCAGVIETSSVQSQLGSGTAKTVTLQYRIAHDAFAPSRFVGVVGDGMTPGLTLVWELPPPKSEDEAVTQQGEKERFHRLLAMLEARQINGVEFECRGWLDGFVLHATAVPRLTEGGSRDVESRGSGSMTPNIPLERTGEG